VCEVIRLRYRELNILESVRRQKGELLFFNRERCEKIYMEDGNLVKK